MLNVMDGLITFVAKYFILIPLVVAIYIFFKLKNDKRQEMLIILFCMGVLSIILAKIGAHLYNDIRPYLSDGTVPYFRIPATLMVFHPTTRCLVPFWRL
jgi:hypothetical protein